MRLQTNDGILRCTDPTAACHCSRTRMERYQTVLQKSNTVFGVNVIAIFNGVSMEAKLRMSPL